MADMALGWRNCAGVAAHLHAVASASTAPSLFETSIRACTLRDPWTRRIVVDRAHDGSDHWSLLRADRKRETAIGNDGLSGTPYRRSWVALVSWQPMQLATRPAAVTWPAGETVA